MIAVLILPSSLQPVSRFKHMTFFLFLLLFLLSLLRFFQFELLGFCVVSLILWFSFIFLISLLIYLPLFSIQCCFYCLVSLLRFIYLFHYKKYWIANLLSLDVNRFSFLYYVFALVVVAIGFIMQIFSILFNK